MPKNVEYPRASLKRSLQLASAIEDLGGKSTIDMLADKMNKKISGGFKDIVNGAVKFGLVRSQKNQLTTTELYRDYQLAYTVDEANKVLQKMFLTPSLFHGIYQRFSGRELPLSHFEKLLIREFNVSDTISSRIAGYFLDGAKQCGLLNDSNILVSEDNLDQFVSDTVTDEIANKNEVPQSLVSDDSSLLNDVVQDKNKYSIRIVGPGMDSVIVINEEEDLLIVEAMLKKVQKNMRSFDANDE